MEPKSEMSNDWRTSEGQWIDPYATKRNKNFRYNKRKEERRIQRIEQIEEAIVKGIELESSSDEETMWK
jgi:hypothetical protein